MGVLPLTILPMLGLRRVSPIGAKFLRPVSYFPSRKVFQNPTIQPVRLFCGGNDDPETPEKPAKQQPKKYDYWKLGFINLIRNPKDNKHFFYRPADADIEGHNVCVVYDRKPKAKKHFLILPTMLIQHYKNLNETHIELLQEMRDVAHQVVKEQKETEEGKDMTFKIGFQAIPGMLQIHLHVVSDDFDSIYMKNKRHWNTFNTEFFVSPDLLIDQLKKQGHVQLDEVHYNTIIKQPLACPHCKVKIPRLPDLMTHLSQGC